MVTFITRSFVCGSCRRAFRQELPIRIYLVKCPCCDKAKAVTEIDNKAAVRAAIFMETGSVAV